MSRSGMDGRGPRRPTASTHGATSTAGTGCPTATDSAPASRRPLTGRTEEPAANAAGFSTPPGRSSAGPYDVKMAESADRPEDPWHPSPRPRPPRHLRVCPQVRPSPVRPRPPVGRVGSHVAGLSSGTAVRSSTPARRARRPEERSMGRAPQAPLVTLVMRRLTLALTVALLAAIVIPATVSAAWPVASRTAYISQRASRHHPAIDIAAHKGSRVVPIASGTVVFAGYKSNCGGYQVWIRNRRGIYTAY